jgi:hypothetical protein
MTRRSGRMRDPDTLLRIVSEHAARRPPVSDEQHPGLAKVLSMITTEIAHFDACPEAVRRTIAGMRLPVAYGNARKIHDAIFQGVPADLVAQELRSAEANALKTEGVKP